MEVEGEYKFYRAEKFIREALSRPPAEAGIPFIRDGYLWRSRGRFRTNYTLYNSVTHEPSKVESLAIEGDKRYQFVGQIERSQGTLGIFDSGTVSGDGVLNVVKSNYHSTLNCTWGGVGRSYSEYLQMPEIQIATLAGDEEGFAISLRHGPTQSEAEFHFLSAPGFPLKYMRSKSGSVHIELQVVSKVIGGMSLPERYVEAVSFGPDSAYTFVAELDLKPLQPESPISRPIDQDSFRDLGIEYEVVKEEEASTDETLSRPAPTTILLKVAKLTGVAGLSYSRFQNI